MRQRLPPPLPESTARPIAHWAHTLALFSLLGFTTWFGHRRVDVLAQTNAPSIPHYGLSIALEWLLLVLVLAGIYHRRDFLRTAFRNRARSNIASLGYGAMVYVMGFMAVAVTGAALYFTPLFKKRNEAAILGLLPHSPMQFAVWFAVSLTAGICEELIFRGYLQQQLTAWLQRPVLAILLGALIFGSVHLYEGLGAIVPLAALAVVYGLVVHYYRGDLRAVIVAHTLQDFLVAFFALARPALEHMQPKH